jgi:hypothetical protein
MGIFSRFWPLLFLRLVGFFAICFLATPFYTPRLSAQWNPLNPVQSWQKDLAGVRFVLERGALRFQVCGDSMIRVLYSPQREFPHVVEYVVIKSDWPKTQFDVRERRTTSRSPPLE